MTSTSIDDDEQAVAAATIILAVDNIAVGIGGNDGSIQGAAGKCTLVSFRFDAIAIPDQCAVPVELSGAAPPEPTDEFAILSKGVCRGAVGRAVHDPGRLGRGGCGELLSLLRG